MNERVEFGVPVFRNISTLRRFSRGAMAIGTLFALGAAAIPNPVIGHLGGAVSAIATLVCGLIVERIEWVREQEAIPRSIEVEQMARFTAFTGHQSKGDVRIVVSMGDSEAAKYAEHVRELLRMGGWQVTVDPISGRPSGGAWPTGLTLRTYNVNADEARFLRDAFREASIQIATVHVPELTRLEIFVGAKPTDL